MSDQFVSGLPTIWFKKVSILTFSSFNICGEERCLFLGSKLFIFLVEVTDHELFVEFMQENSIAVTHLTPAAGNCTVPAYQVCFLWRQPLRLPRSSEIFSKVPPPSLTSTARCALLFSQVPSKAQNMTLFEQFAGCKTNRRRNRSCPALGH